MLRQLVTRVCRRAGATAPTSLALTLKANILTQQSATALGKGVSASDPNIHVPGTEAYQKYQAAIATAKVVSSQIANQRDLAAVTVSYAAQTICSGIYHTALLSLPHPSRAPRQAVSYLSYSLLICLGFSSCRAQ